MRGVGVGKMKQVFTVSFGPCVENRVENVILLSKILVPLYFGQVLSHSRKTRTRTGLEEGK